VKVCFGDMIGSSRIDLYSDHYASRDNHSERYK